MAPSSVACSRSSTEVRTVSPETGARARTVTWRRTSSSCRRRASRRGSAFCNCAAGGIRTADDPLFRPIDADDFRTRGEEAADFSNLRENGLVRIVFPLPEKIKLVDPATNAPSSETFVDVWRAVPTVNDVALTGPDGTNPWARGPNNTGGYQMDARVSTLQDQALGALTNHAQVQSVPPPGLLDDLASFQRVLFTNHRVRTLSDALRRGRRRCPMTDRRSPSSRRKGRWCSRAPAPSVMAARRLHGQPPVVRFHTILSQCPRPVDSVAPARFVFAACPDRLARNARSIRDHAVGSDGVSTARRPCHAMPVAVRAGGPTPPLPAGAKVRRTSSDPGRALLTGYVGGLPGTRRSGEAGYARPSRDPQDRAVFPQQQRGHARRGGRSLHRVLQARAGRRRPRRGASGHHHRRRALRSPAGARGARGVARLSASGNTRRPVDTAGLRPPDPLTRPLARRCAGRSVRVARSLRSLAGLHGGSRSSQLSA